LDSTFPLRPSGFPLRPLRYSTHRRPRKLLGLRFILLSASVLLQSITTLNPPTRCYQRGSSSHEVPCLFALDLRGSAVAPGSMPMPPSAPRFSQPLDGLLPTELRRLISSRTHVQAFPFRGFPSPEAISARRRDPALLGLPRPLLLLRGEAAEAPLQGLALLENPLRPTRS